MSSLGSFGFLGVVGFFGVFGVFGFRARVGGFGSLGSGLGLRVSELRALGVLGLRVEGLRV